MIQPIVEGQGEVQAIRILLEHLLTALSIYALGINRPLRHPRPQMVREQDLKRLLQVARSNPQNQAILIMFDSDDDCARSIVPKMAQWAKEEIADLPCAIVLARREYEAWFLASIESLRGKCRIRDNATYPGNPEAKRGAKEQLCKFMPRNRPYDETADQPSLTAAFDLGMAYKRASSFRKLVKELCHILKELGHEPTIPKDWQPE